MQSEPSELINDNCLTHCKFACSDLLALRTFAKGVICISFHKIFLTFVMEIVRNAVFAKPLLLLGAFATFFKVYDIGSQESASLQRNCESYLNSTK